MTKRVATIDMKCYSILNHVIEATLFTIKSFRYLLWKIHTNRGERVFRYQMQDQHPQPYHIVKSQREMRLSILSPPHCLIREDMSRTLTFIYSKSPEELVVHCRGSNLPEEAEVTMVLILMLLP